MSTVSASMPVKILHADGDQTGAGHAFASEWADFGTAATADFANA